MVWLSRFLLAPMNRIAPLFAVAVLCLLLAIACSPAANQPVATEAPATGLDAYPSAATPTPKATTPPTAANTATASPAPSTDTLTPTLEPTATATPVPPTETPSPTTEPPTPTEPPAAARASVSLENFSFTPQNLTVRTGTTVVWTNQESARHTVTADDGSFASDVLSNGGVFEFTFNTPGTFAYYCRFHGGPGQEGMSGVITVTE